MKAPEDERAELLGVAIRHATDLLRAPVDRVEVTDARVTCWAGSRKVPLSYVYAEGGSLDPETGRFAPNPGSGGWQVSVADDPGSGQPELIGRAFAKLLKKRGW